MISRFSAWVNEINTTALRMIVSIALAAQLVVFVEFGMLVQGWEPTAMQYKVLTGIAFLILIMMGYDVAQFIGKRFTEADFVAAKTGSQPIPVVLPLPQLPTGATAIVVPVSSPPPPAPLPAMPPTPVISPPPEVTPTPPPPIARVRDD